MSAYLGTQPVFGNLVYQNFSGDNSTTAFVLSYAPGTVNGIDVFISGVYQQKTSYSVTGTTLTFTEAPPTGTNNIEVMFRGVTISIGTPADGTVTQVKLDSAANSILNVASVRSNSSYNLANNSTGFKNRIIGGDFGTNPWQRGTTFASPAHATYSADRFNWSLTGAGTVTITKDTASLPNTSKPTIATLKIAVTAADTSIAAGDYYGIEQKIEGLNVSDLGFGSSDAKSITLSFDVRSTKTGIHSISFMNSATNRSYAAEYTVNVSNTWERKTIAIAGDTTGTWLTTNGIGLRITWLLMAGSTYQTSPGSWGTTGWPCSSNQVNVMDSTSNTFYLANIQLEVGNQATAFENRSVSQELSLCQRYFHKSFTMSQAPVSALGVNNGEVVQMAVNAGAVNYNGNSILWPVEMRAPPTVTIYNPVNSGSELHCYSAGDSTGTTGVGNTTRGMSRVQCTQHASSVVGTMIMYHYTASAEL